MDSGCTNRMTGDKELFIDDNLSLLLRSTLPSMTTTKGKLLVWVRLPYRKINILTKLCLFNPLDITLCLFQSYVIWACWCCFLLLVVLCFHRMTILLSSRDIVKEIFILLIFPRD